MDGYHEWGKGLDIYQGKRRVWSVDINAAAFAVARLLLIRGANSNAFQCSGKVNHNGQERQQIPFA